MSYIYFKSEFLNCIFINCPDPYAKEQLINDAYTLYKESVCYREGLSVFDWCKIQYKNSTFENSILSLKENIT